MGGGGDELLLVFSVHTSGKRLLCDSGDSVHLDLPSLQCLSSLTVASDKQ